MPDTRVLRGRRILGALCATLVLITPVACRTTDHYNASGLKAPGSEGIRTVPEAVQFRDVLYTRLGRQFRRDDFLRACLLLDANYQQGDQASFDRIVKRTAEKTPEDLYQLSVANPPSAAPAVNPSGAPLTIVVFPGLISELAMVDIFPEATNNTGSAFARHVRAKLARASHGQRVDRRFSLADLKEIEVPLTDVIKTGSIDDKSGHPIVQVIEIYPVLGSLESVGSVYDLYPILKRRLDKIFSIIGPQERIYIAGHSRGSVSALDFIARGSKDNSIGDWMQNVKGFIGLNGALFGSHYAEAYFDKTSKAYTYHTTIAGFANLKEDSDAYDSMVNRDKLLGGLIDMGLTFVSDKRLDHENYETPMPDITFGLKAGRALSLEFAPDSYFDEYPRHIRRIKTAAAAMETAVRELRHEARLKWWATHTLPTKLRYYTFTSTLPSQVNSSKVSRWQKGLLDSPVMDRDSLQYQGLRRLYFDYTRDASVSINDGLVGLADSTFWPELHQKLNPRQKPYKAVSLGVFAADHVAIAYEQVGTDDDDAINPFPRRAFLEALAVFTAQKPAAVVERGGGGKKEAREGKKARESRSRRAH